jgi:hypothetical protein
MTWSWEEPEAPPSGAATGTYIPEGEASDAAEAPASASIALMGDSTVACHYLPPANRPENHLLVRLRREFPDRRFVVQNVAGEGESPAADLRSGRLERLFAAVPQMHLAFLRYNIRDTEPEGFQEHLDGLQTCCGALRQRYPGITVIIETGIWVHHPSHYVGDSHAHAAPRYDQVKAWAVEAGYPVVDIYQKMQAEAAKGNWDLRVRGLPTPEQTVVDDTFDAFFGEEPLFFANLHPNSRCLALIADWEVGMLKLLARK